MSLPAPGSRRWHQTGGVSGENKRDGSAVLAAVLGRLRRARRRLVAALVVACLLSLVPDPQADRVFLGGAAILLVVVLLITIAVQRLHWARTWPGRTSMVRIWTTGEWRSQRVRAVIGDAQQSWRCTNVLGIETKQTFTGQAFVWTAPNGRTGVVAWPPSKVRFLTEPRPVG